MPTWLASPYLLGALALVMLLSMGTAYVEHQSAKRYQAERDTALHDVAQYKVNEGALRTAVTSKDTVIDKLTASLKTWQQTAKDSLAKQQAVVATLQAKESERTALRTKLSQLEGKDRTLPDCAALMAIDVAKVCPNTAEAMRERAAHD